MQTFDSLDVVIKDVRPGLDDGAATLVESLAIARAAVADGVTVLAATPHVRDDYPTRAETMLELLAEVHVAIALEGIPLRLVGGGEVALELVSRLSFDELRRFGLAGNPGYLLVESPARGWVPEVGRLLAELRRNGITPVLADHVPDCVYPMVLERGTTQHPRRPEAAV